MKHCFKELTKVLNIFCIVVFVFGSAVYSNVSAQDGEKLFKAHCSACHRVDKDMVGPSLKGVEERWAGKGNLLHEWIKNPAKVRDMGDPYVDKMLKEWMPRGGLMAAQMVTDEEIDAMLEYIEAWEPEVATAPAGEPGATAGGDAAPAADQGVSVVWLLIIAFILLILIFSLAGVRSSLTRLNTAILDAEGKETPVPVSSKEKFKSWAWKNKSFVAIISVIVVVYLSVIGYDALMGIGVYQGYTPDQPIKFNHTLHAGENQIACVYCHSGALQSKSAGIPSANICMNCHNGIDEGRTPEGTAEIAKIYDAIGWDPETRSYSGEEKPIKWVKVHNLPDHAYFNHAQHYVVGELECQDCHGQIQEDYTVAGQFAPLTMGWCIDCHNTSSVNMDGNGYYDEVHARLQEHGKEELKRYLEDGSITVRELGGWECSKCHY